MAKETKPGFSIRLRQLKRKIEGGEFSPCYLVCGPQGYLRSQNADYIVEKLIGSGDRQMNLTRFSGNGFTAKEVIDLAETMPFFAERRVIYLRDTGLWEKGMNAEADALSDYLGSQPETTSFVFCEENIDRKRSLYKAIVRTGEVLECDTPEQDKLERWAASQFTRNDISIDRKTLALFLGTVGEDMTNIVTEAEKLCSYCAETGTVTEADVRSVTSGQAQDRIFDLIRAAGRGDRDRAMAVYTDLRALETPPQVILSLMIRQYTLLIQVRELMDRGFQAKEIALAVHSPEFAVTKDYIPMVRGLARRDLERSLDLCVGADASYKSGKISDRLAVEVLIAGQMCGGPGGEV
ncbi:MAG: DNA polymerase III subunit delta [Lachnospiraceae bacterium]|nr:DNA polymerase III subunit delta [Lachnospiraceae bacterium]